MKEIRKLNAQGIEKFSKFIEAHQLGQKPPLPYELKRDDQWTIALGRGERDIETIDFTSQWTMARDLLDLFKGAGIKAEDREGPEMWAWLSLVFFEQICPKSQGGNWKPGPLNLWVPSDIWQRFYRHFLAGPFRIYEMHLSKPELTRSLLNAPPRIQTEIYAQIVASQEIAQSEGVLDVVRLLYWNSETDTLKTGHAGKGAGSVRRFARFMNQISLTWDLNDVSGAELFDLLPAEYDRFKST